MALSSVTQTASVPARDEVRQLANNMAILFANGVIETGTIAIAGTKSKVQTTATCLFKVNGALKSKAATDNLFVLAGTTVAISSFQKYLLMLDASGTASTAQGVQSTVSAAAVVLPAPPQDVSIVGVLTVATSGAGTFIPGTTLLDAAQVTATYVDGFDPSLLKIVVLA